MEFLLEHVEFHRQVERQSDADAFAQGLDQVVEAERWGLDSVWLAEIHQQAERSVLSAPLTVAAAIAGRTTRLKIGTGVQVLPLCHPLRLAEETATIDQITRGRLLLGAGRSGNPRSYAAYGVPYAESRERFYETLEILKLAWTQTSFSYAGKFWQFDNARAVPRPYQQPHPEIRIAGASEDTFPTLGALGYPLFVAVRSGSLSGLAPDLKAYREAYKEAGCTQRPWRRVSTTVAAPGGHRRAGDGRSRTQHDAGLQEAHDPARGLAQCAAPRGTGGRAQHHL